MIEMKLDFHSSIFHIILLVFILTIVNDKIIMTKACPSNVCVCKWKSGKQTVECGGQLLSEIPDGIDPGTQILNFSGNSLQVLRSERFLKMDLINLQKIYLSRNQLIKIHEKAFRGLSNLVELDLSDNMLQQIPTDTFQDYPSLMRLSISNNPIRELKTGSFRHLSFLTTLEINNCQIEKVEDEAFIGMDNLEWLRLDGNRISFIQGNHILPKALHGISLQNNRWVCDCRLTDVHAWLINYNTPQNEEPKCVDPPRLKGKVIKLLKKNELACLPEVTPQSSYTEIAEGRNISLQCTVRALPEAKVFWLFNGQHITNDSLLEALHLYYYIDESGIVEKHSEVFIYNVGPENNGTFSCYGQNVAGISHTNYTIRVLIKKPPVVKETSFSKDYMNVIIASGGGAGIILIIVLCFIVVRCSMKKSKNKRSNSETSTSEAGILKCPSIINDEDLLPKSSKENGVMIGNTMKQSFMMYVPAQQSDHILDNNCMQLNTTSTLTPTLVNADGHPTTTSLTNQYCSPQSSIRSFVEKNPDLINDAESVKNKIKNTSEYEGSDYSTGGPCSMQTHYDNYYQLPKQFGSQIIRNNAPQRMPFGTALTKGQDRFTHDFSNNHLHKSQTLVPNQQNYYRTLPHNRGHNKFIASSAANPGARYSLEAEFLQRSNTPSYDKYMHTMRFTADGYTMHPIQYPSPPEGYKGDYSLPESVNSGQSICISTANFQQWPPCLPGYHHTQQLRHPTITVPAQTIILNTAQVGATASTSQSSQTEISQQQQQQQQQQHPLSSSSVASVQVIHVPYSNNTSSDNVVTTSSASTLTNEIKKRCVSAQTTELNPATIYECEEDYDNSKLRHLSSPLADSPDEGYVGDSQEGSDI